MVYAMYLHLFLCAKLSVRVENSVFLNFRIENIFQFLSIQFFARTNPKNHSRRQRSVRVENSVFLNFRIENLFNILITVYVSCEKDLNLERY